MEALIELIIQVFLLLFEVFGELIIQLIFELIFDSISRAVVKTLFWEKVSKNRENKPINLIIAVIRYLVFGAVVGGLSLLLLPNLLIKIYWLSIANIFFTPIIAGCCMLGLGVFRSKIGNEKILLNTFAYGFCFALAMALVRFFFCS